MKVLAIELATAQGSLAWFDGNEEVVRRWPNDRKNSGDFFHNLAEIQKKYGSPEKIIVGLGPGSYAGTRIAISAAIGLSLGGRCAVGANVAEHDGAYPSLELLGYPSICAMPVDQPEYCVIGDARRQSFFFARVRDHDLTDGPVLIPEAEVKEKLATIGKSLPIL